MSADTSPLQRTSSSRPVPPKDGAQVEEEEKFDTREALPHFRLLVEFIDEFLARQVLLLQQLNRGLEDRIALEDLWMLLMPESTFIALPRREALFTTAIPLAKAVTRARWEGLSTQLKHDMSHRYFGWWARQAAYPCEALFYPGV